VTVSQIKRCHPIKPTKRCHQFDPNVRLRGEYDTQPANLGPPSHPLSDHGPSVSLSEIRRAVVTGEKASSSKFIDRATTEASIRNVVKTNQADIDIWLATNPGAGQNKAFTQHGTTVVGVGFRKVDGVVVARPDLTSVRVVLKSRGDGSYIIQTAFPL
jgi:Bacterial CdiA-CT RNAse A domain